jgi:hypothetical protein
VGEYLILLITTPSNLKTISKSENCRFWFKKKAMIKQPWVVVVSETSKNK